MIAAKVNLSFVDEFNWFPLLYACAYDQLEITKLLLKAGCDVNQVSSDTKTSGLIFAAHYDNVEIVEVLLDAGAEINH